MDKITKIELQKNNKDRFSIFVNDDYGFSVNAETLYKFNLAENMLIDEKLKEKLQISTNEYAAIKKVANILSKMLKTKMQVVNLLKQNGYNEEIQNNVVAKFEEYKLIDDENYIKCFVASHKDWGEIKLKSQLIKNGVDKNLIDKFFSVFVQDVENVQRMFDKYMKNKQISAQNLQKAKIYLAGKGFKYSQISAVVKGDSYGNWN